jgi:iron(III) transport system ATP-binding protein
LSEPLLICKNLTKRFAKTLAIANLSLSVYPGECLALVGPSGCGKTTLLRLLAGFERPDAGSLWLNGQSLVQGNQFVPPEARRIGFVFQDYALFPHLRVGENIAFGLAQLPKTAKVETVQQMLELVNLQHAEERYPHELSGGERQRVALARALAPHPDILLLDEPFSNLDADRRALIRTDIRRILREQQITAVFVTHDQEEAFYMGDRLAVMLNGTVCQVGEPEVVFQEPASKDVAEFLGGTEFLTGTVQEAGIITPLGFLAQIVSLPVGTRVEVGVRADDVNMRTALPHNAVITERIYKGAYQVYLLCLEGGRQVSAMQAHTTMLPEGEGVQAFLDAGHPLAIFADGLRVESFSHSH